jgi:deazaflavin-dependent oxidoreductase (nitroreductase family)
MMNLFNNLAIRRVRNKGGKLMGSDVLVLNTVGAKSGAPRSNPVAWFAWEGGSWLVVASAGGAVGNPAWYYNLAAHPDQVSIDVNRENIPVVASQLSGTDREKAWEAITTTASQFTQYESKTDRLIPVIRLTRR